MCHYVRVIRSQAGPRPYLHRRAASERQGPRYVPEYVAGIPSETFVQSARPYDLGRQQMSNWCWAAAIQMVLGVHGIPVQQAALVAQAYGEPINQPAGADQIVASLNGHGTDFDGRAVDVFTRGRVNDTTVVDDLREGKPLVVGLRGDPSGKVSGHAYVLSAVEFDVDRQGQPVIDRFILRDPWPLNPSRVEMSAEEFHARCTFATRVDSEPGLAISPPRGGRNPRPNERDLPFQD